MRTVLFFQPVESTAVLRCESIVGRVGRYRNTANFLQRLCACRGKGETAFCSAQNETVVFIRFLEVIKQFCKITDFTDVSGFTSENKTVNNSCRGKESYGTFGKALGTAAGISYGKLKYNIRTVIKCCLCAELFTADCGCSALDKVSAHYYNGGFGTGNFFCFP